MTRHNQVLLLKLSDGQVDHPATLKKSPFGAPGTWQEAQCPAGLDPGPDQRHLCAPGRDHPPLRQPGRPQGHGDSQAAAHDQLQGLRLCHLHGLCRRPAGRARLAWTTARRSGKRRSGRNGNSSRPIWKASAGGPWTAIEPPVVRGRRGAAHWALHFWPSI